MNFDNSVNKLRWIEHNLRMKYPCRTFSTELSHMELGIDSSNLKMAEALTHTIFATKTPYVDAFPLYTVIKKKNLETIVPQYAQNIVNDITLILYYAHLVHLRMKYRHYKKYYQLKLFLRDIARDKIELIPGVCLLKHHMNIVKKFIDITNIRRPENDHIYIQMLKNYIAEFLIRARIIHYNHL